MFNDKKYSILFKNNFIVEDKWVLFEKIKFRWNINK